MCDCLREHVESWGEGVKATCKTARSTKEFRIVEVSTTDRHAGTQYFVVHEGSDGAVVLGLLEHHVPGGGGVYRDFKIDDARVEKVGAGRVLRIATTLVEREVEVGKTERELSRDENVTLCTLSTPAGGTAPCIRLALRERGIDEVTGKPWERVYELELDPEGSVSHVPKKGTATEPTTHHRLW